MRRLTIVSPLPGCRATQRHLALHGLPEADLAVALALAGDGLVVTSERRHRLVAWPLRPGGGIGARRALSRPGAHVTGQLGVTADGRVTWRQAQGSYATRVASGAP